MVKTRSTATRSALIAILASGAALGAISGAEAQLPWRAPAAKMTADGFYSVADLVEEVSPAVVSVMVEREVEAPRMPSQLEDFFFRFGERGRPEMFGDQPRTMSAQGSGFFIDDEGHIVTNNHVIEGADRIMISVGDGEERVAELVGADPETDLAVLKVEAPKNQKYVQFAENTGLRVGDRVVAVGNPFGLSGTVTSGIVSALGREGGQFTDFIQIDAPINRGNSGGPTFDLQGRVVGVNTAIYSTNGGSVGIGFAIPADLAKSTVAQLIKNGAVTRGWLGVSLQEVTSDIAKALGRPNEKGALVAQVIPETPAQKAGFESGDVILKLGSKTIEDSRDLSRSVSALAPGEKVKVEVEREGKKKILNVTLGKRGDADEVAANDNAGGSGSLSEDLGIRLADLDDELRRQYRIPEDVEGAVITGVRRGGPASEAGLQTGTVILKVDGEAVSDSDEAVSKIDNARKSKRGAVLLQTQRNAVKQFTALPLATSEGE
ncbi:MAG: Do family serine endopeptidase [Pseudomonadota bacterium]